MNCMHINCYNAATHQIGFSVRAVGHEDKPPAEVWFGIVVCDDHKNPGHVKSIMTPPARAALENTFKLAGKAKPDLDAIEPLFYKLPPDGKTMGNTL